MDQARERDSDASPIGPIIFMWDESAKFGLDF